MGRYRTTRALPCKTACAKQVSKLSRADLPLSCPLPEECLWNAHPRVYLALDEEGHTQCPYCGTRYELDLPKDEPNEHDQQEEP